MKKGHLSKDIETILQSFNILYHDALLDDIENMLSKSGNELKFYSLFLSRITMLEQSGYNLIISPNKNFEHLTNEENLYSIHINIKKNAYRILFSFLNDGTLLLTGFTERSGKKNTDYTNAKSIARQRLYEFRRIENGY